MNPFKSFLLKADLAMAIANHAGVDRSDIEAYAKNREELAFCGDLFDRVELLAHSYNDLLAATDLFDEMFRRQAGASEITLEELAREHACWLRVDVAVSMILYETKSIVEMLKQWQITVAPTSELAYLLKVRDRFLTHPQLRRIARKGYRGGAVPLRGAGPTLRDVIGINRWDTESRRYYLSKLGLPADTPIVDQQKSLENEAVIRSARRNEQISEQEIVQIKAFGVREPDIVRAANELAVLLESQALPWIEKIHQSAIDRFKYERNPYPDQLWNYL